MKHLVDNITMNGSTATNTELSQFCTLFMSLEMEQEIKNSGYDWDSGVEKLENELVRRVNEGSIDALTFSQLCYSIDKDVPMSKFIEAIIPQAKKWLDLGELECSDLPYILSATAYD